MVGRQKPLHTCKFHFDQLFDAKKLRTIYHRGLWDGGECGSVARIESEVNFRLHIGSFILKTFSEIKRM